MTTPLLEVDHLHVTLSPGGQACRILNGISFKLFPGETVGLVGESGSGKSMTAAAILGLLPPGHQTTGCAIFEGQDLLDTQIDHPRGKKLSLILQDPALALNPLLSIGRQLVEGLIFHQKIASRLAWEQGTEWLRKVGIRDPLERMKQFPHELSGGMKQRILIAMALICRPSLLIADEPTTALDVTVQVQILDLLKRLQQEERLSMLLITHDLGVVAHSCQRVMVMYGGQIVETGSVEQIFESPCHPYTQALLRSRRSLSMARKEPLFSLEGHPSQQREPTGCAFAPRCPFAMNICLAEEPPNEEHSTRSVRCWLSAAKERA